MADCNADLPAFSFLETKGWEVWESSGNELTVVEFTKVGLSDVQLSISFPYVNDEQMGQAVDDLIQNGWGQFPFESCMDAIQDHSSCEVCSSFGAVIRVDFLDTIIDLNNLSVDYAIKFIANVTAEIDEGLSALKTDLEPVTTKLNQTIKNAESRDEPDIAQKEDLFL